MSNSQPKGLNFFLASSQDTKYLHAEVYHSDFFICIVDTEKGEFNICFSADPRINPSHDSVEVNLNDFIRTLEKAKEELLKFHNGINDAF
jgi:hypothetical protein